AEVGDDLIEGGIDEAVELDLRYRSCPCQRHTHRRADDGRLVEGSVDDPLLPEVAVEAFCDPEHATRDPDVLAGQDRLVMALHPLTQGGIDRLSHGPALSGPAGERVLVYFPDLLGREGRLRLTVGTLHGVELVDDMGGDAGEGVADR